LTTLVGSALKPQANMASQKVKGKGKKIKNEVM
jgi:hypothetical protein